MRSSRSATGSGLFALAIAGLTAVSFAGIAGIARADGAASLDFAAMQSAWDAGDLEKATTFAEKLLREDPENVESLSAIGSLFGERASKAPLFTRLSWAKRCRETWEKAERVDPTYLPVRMKLVRFYARAPGLAGGGLEKARAEANAIAAIDPVRGEEARATIERERGKNDRNDKGGP